MKRNETISAKQALEKLSEDLIQRPDSINVGSFYEFVRDVWSYSYDNREYFNAWHVGVVCDDVERCIQDGLFYAAVMPRYHLKSTILGHAFSIWWLLKSKKRDSDLLYLSFSDGMAQRHISEINKAVRRNPKLSNVMENRSPNADFSFRYFANRKQVEIIHGGLFSFKRGMHTSGLIADDILRDEEKKTIDYSQLQKAQQHFETESIFIPVKGSPVIVLGTPIAPDDLFTKIKKDDRFFVRVLPALDPVPNKRVLWPEQFPESWLLKTQKSNSRSFASEFMLAPMLNTMSYLKEEDVKAVENSELRSFHIDKRHEFDSEFTVAGFDIGKKNHPSHLSICTSKGNKLTQVCSLYLDHWDFTRQVQLLNDAVDNFAIDKAYFDNTRGELEDRNLNSVWRGLVFTQKSKGKMAQVFEEYVLNKKVELIADERQRMHIISVDGELNAPETPLGHGDAFWSNALVVLAHYETASKGTTDLGDLQGFGDISMASVPDPYKDFTKRIYNNERPAENSEVCPQCNQSFGWISENKTCIICRYRAPR